MARRVSLALLGTGLGLTALLPLVGIVAMVMGAVGLAITLEHDLASEAGQPPGAVGS
jgi:hypothetical protein